VARYFTSYPVAHSAVFHLNWPEVVLMLLTERFVGEGQMEAPVQEEVTVSLESLSKVLCSSIQGVHSDFNSNPSQGIRYSFTSDCCVARLIVGEGEQVASPKEQLKF
jgi:hypothetical protein